MFKRLPILLALAGGLIAYAHHHDSDDAIAQTFSGQSGASIGCFNVTASIFGGNGNNSVDNAPAFTNALTALSSIGGGGPQTGGCIYFPPGTYKFNSQPSFTYPAGVFSVAVQGGGQDNTVLTWPNAAGGLAFNFNGFTSSLHIRDLSLTTGVTTGGAALAISSTVSNNNSLFATSDLYRVTIRGADGYAATDYWTTGIAVTDVGSINLKDVTILGSASQQGAGMSVVGATGTSTYATPFNITDSFFTSLATGFLYGSFVQGVTINHTNFTGTLNGIVTNGGETGTLDQLAINNSQFNPVAASGNALALNTAINNLTITGSRFIGNAATDTGANIQASKATTIVGNNFTGNGAASQVGLNLVATNSLPCIVTGNTFNGFNGTSATALILGAGTSGCVVDGNSFTNNTTAATDSGSGNLFWNNLGADSAWTTFTGSVACGSATITTNSTRRRTVGKQTWVEADFNITALGTCTTSLTFNLPNTANSGGSISGRGIASLKGVNCSVLSAGTAATCSNTDASNFATGQMVLSGVYENQ